MMSKSSVLRQMCKIFMESIASTEEYKSPFSLNQALNLIQMKQKEAYLHEARPPIGKGTPEGGPTVFERAIKKIPADCSASRSTYSVGELALLERSKALCKSEGDKGFASTT